MQSPELIYVGDPMCSWCWGFAPVLDELAERFRMPIRMVVGGLRPGPSAEVVDDRMAEFLAHHWEQVHERSGQPFNHAILSTRGWRYDTELPAVAIVTMRALLPEAELTFFTRLQRAFYAENLDITRQETYPALLDGYDVDAAKFMELLAGDEMKWKAWEDFEHARSLGVTGFPTLLLRVDQIYTVTRGYAPAAPLVTALADWLIDRFPDEADAMICEIGEPC